MTGASGFVGGHVLKQLRSEGASVVPLSRRPNQDGYISIIDYLNDPKGDILVHLAQDNNRTRVNQDGNAYQPYGPAGIPYTMDGGSLEKWTPAGAGSEQALAYLDSAPGAQAREMYQERTCSPLWSNVFGCKEGGTIWVHNDAIAEHEPSFFDKLKSLFGAEEYNADLALSVSWKGILTLVGSLAVIGIVGTRIMKEE